MPRSRRLAPSLRLMALVLASASPVAAQEGDAPARELVQAGLHGIAGLGLAGAEAGDACLDLWFSRNRVMDRAGYCFGSPLGRALFGEGACRGKSVGLGAADRAVVARLRARERALSCAVDTGDAAQSLPDDLVRRRLTRQPVRAEAETACLGWMEAPAALRAAPDAAADPVGAVEEGDRLLFAHEPVGDWAYVTLRRDDGTVFGGGWLQSPAGAPPRCAVRTG